jgi:hypothetical protein
MIQTRSCPNCLRKVDVSAFKVGARVRCPYCRKEFEVQLGIGAGPAPAVRSKPRFENSARVQVEGYEDLHQIGKGAMGSVFTANQTKLRRKVALKVLAQEHADRAGFLDRFKREAATGARITHRNVVRVYDILTGMSYDSEGKGTQVHVISMEFVDGPHLRRLCETEDPPLRENTSKALAYFRQICAGVAAAHEQGIVHRDLKPENIMLDREAGMLKVADFGLAYFKDRDEADNSWDTHTRMTMGTVAYMPPEQGKDAKRVVESGDVFSLGRILYELLIGSLPDGSFTAASKLNARLPESIDEIISRCLQGEPKDRFQSATDLLVAFDLMVVEMDREEAQTALVDVQPEAEVMPVAENDVAAAAPPVLRMRGQGSPLSARYPLWAIAGVPLVLGLLLGAWMFGGGSAAVEEPGQVWLLDTDSERSIKHHTILPDYSEVVGGLWSRNERFLDHAGSIGSATVAQTTLAFAIGEDLSFGALAFERRVEWAAEGDAVQRDKKLGDVAHWVAVGFIANGERSWVGIDARGDCHVFEAGQSRPCGLGRGVITPARLNLRQVGDKIEITVDNQEVLPERLKAPNGPAKLIVMCQNQHCRFDPKKR